MKQKKGFVLREVCGERVIVCEGLNAVDFGKLISLNDTAAWLWQKMAELGDSSIEQLADELCNQYDVEKDQALSDVTALVTKWKNSGLIE